MIVLAGPSPHSLAKLKVLTSQARALVPRIATIDALYLHLVITTSDAAKKVLSTSGTDGNITLNALLAYGDNLATEETRQACATQDATNVVYVLPRPRTLSSWSSKATDIIRICNLGSLVDRLERGVFYRISTLDGTKLDEKEWTAISHLIHDRMTQALRYSAPERDYFLAAHEPRPLRTIPLVRPLQGDAMASLRAANVDLGLALAEGEIEYLVSVFVSAPDALRRDPTDAELFMFAQINSEHCRHKIFNADWTVDDVRQPKSLFDMIRNTEAAIQGRYTISAYSDNAAVFEGYTAPRFAAAENNHSYGATNEAMPILIKVETHNHPTAVSPFPGAATGSGGEIRDEGAVGRGSTPKAGLSGFTVSNLLIPSFKQPWEIDVGRPGHIASSLDIMIEGPLGASAFNNEFGRPALCGYFRTFNETVSYQDGDRFRGYHKPIMIAGGLGNVRPAFAKKSHIHPGAKIVVLGGPGLLIGLGGGAASSKSSGDDSAHLDFASVQRENPEMQRRCQQVINSCVSLGEGNPIESIHDVGAGGLSNALPELVHDSGLGARFEIRDILVDDHSMSPMEIWCNESQERYVLAIAAERLQIFEAICKRERCPFSVVGNATEEEKLIVTDRLLGQDVVDLKMATLFSKPPKMSRKDSTVVPIKSSFNHSLEKLLPNLPNVQGRLMSAVDRVLRLPAVGSKSFLITIGDRSVTGLVTRDQMVGPWQVPVSDVAVTRTTYGFDVLTGEAMAMGERTPLSLLNAAASARMAVGEALTNLAASCIRDVGRVKLSANWMCAASIPGEGARLYEAVRAVGEDLCPALGLGIPVGKDSMSMSLAWNDRGEAKKVTSPLSLIVTAFAGVDDVSRTWTPQLQQVDEETVLLFVDLAGGKMRLGGSALAQVFGQIGSETPDVEDAGWLKAFFDSCYTLKQEHPSLVLAYHDRSDGGLFTTVAEMCFAGRLGVQLDLDILGSQEDTNSILFNEELGAVFQVREKDVPVLRSVFNNSGCPERHIHVLGSVTKDQQFTISSNGYTLYASDRETLQAMWAETSYHMQTLRDDPACAEEEFGLIKDSSHRGLYYECPTIISSPSLVGQQSRPRVAILREQGVNGHVEMAWAFFAAGFEAIDVHMSDLLAGTVNLEDFRGLAACGGFSYGDVLGAGNGWAKSVLLSGNVRHQFKSFFERTDTFALAVCNGCQLFSHLKAIIPGAESWPQFKSNRSARFEARVSMVEVVAGASTERSVFLRDMVGWKIPVAVAHGEGRAEFVDAAHHEAFDNQSLLAVRYVDSAGKPSEKYPLNPNGSPDGITGVQTPDGRFLALMPHPERVVTLESNSWHPLTSGRVGPWFQLFSSARAWCA